MGKGLRMLVIAVALASSLGCASAAAWAAEADLELEKLREMHFCEILNYLRTIHAHAPTRYNRYLVIDLGPGPQYVQCLLYEGDGKILCEIASGYYESPRSRLVAPSQLPRLKALGFSTGASKGNYQHRRVLESDETLADIADLLIRALHDIYGATSGDDFRYKAPLVQDPPPPQAYSAGHCAAAIS
jgi:hypothetical protein